MFINYSKDDFDDLKKQHNIMVLVGNGFDISTIKRIGTGNLGGRSTTYSDFYEYIKFYSACNKNNIILKGIEKEKNIGNKAWNNFEAIIGKLVDDASMDYEKLEVDINEFSDIFSRFLNDLVEPELLIKLGNISRDNELAVNSMSKFLGDLKASDRRKIDFPKNITHYDLFNFLFVNFNYTPLLDNYVFLDKTQFDPHRHKNVDRNFSFYPNPEDIKNCESDVERIYSCYVLSNVIHPHGYQDIPRSILFGTDKEKYEKNKPQKRFMKSYWAQNEIKYKYYFEDTELFIIYGMSISETDGWWFSKIYESICNNNSELIIYYYGNSIIENDIKELFINSCFKGARNKKDSVKVMEKIFVIKLDASTNYFLSYRGLK